MIRYKYQWEEQSSHVSFMAGNMRIWYNKYASVQCASANGITVGGFLTRLFFQLRRLCGAFSGKRTFRGISAVTGIYEDRPLSDDEMWSAFAYVFSSKSVNDTSYKFGFLKSILDNLYNVDSELKLTFDQLFSTFAEIYWNLVLKHHILQKNPGKLNRQSALERVLTETKERFAIEDDIPFESISNEAKKYVYHKVKQNCKQNVVGALYADLQQLLYSFDKAGEWIQFNPQMYEFVCKRKVAIRKNQLL